MGVGITFDPDHAEIVSISIAGALDNDGTGAPGHRNFGPGYGCAAGFAAAGAYTGEDLVTFRLRNLASPADLLPDDRYPLALAFFDNTAGFVNFIDGGSNGIDSDIAFGSGAVVVPEPTSLAILGLGGLALIRRKRR
jgi:hypothetical protein